MIAIIDYGLGNVRAFVNLYERLNIPVSIANKPSDLRAASKLILPGVGAFDHAMSLLNESGMRDSLEQMVILRKTPILGICVGMQVLAQSSEEGDLSGLGWIDGRVRKLKVGGADSGLPLPHMGWNTIQPVSENPFISNLTNNARFYFLHSFYFECNNSKDSIATTEYGTIFSSMVNKENIYGVQYHPEKSHHWGITLLKKFAAL
jgi:glutamine amidotransferase